MAYLMAAILLSCDRQHIEPTTSHAEIAFDAKESVTKGFIDNETLLTNGTSFTIYGFYEGAYLTNTEGQEMAGNNIIYDISTNSWPIYESGNERHYYWLRPGDYRFYGWIKHDGASSMDTPLEASYSDSDETLSVSGVVDGEYDQFDFIYSDVHNRTIDSPISPDAPTHAVELHMNHLLTAFGIGAKNTTESQITITRVAIEGLHDTGTAVVLYEETSNSITYSTSKSYNGAFLENNTEIILPAKVGDTAGEIADILRSNSSTQTYFMAWPQKKDILSPVNPTGNFSSDGSKIYESTDSLIVIEYTQGVHDYEKRLKFPSKDWEPGKKNHFDIRFTDKMIELSAVVNSWDYNNSDIDYAENTITFKDAGVLTWSNCIVDDEKKEVSVLSGQPVEAKFCFDTPTGGTWIVFLNGDFNAFEIREDSNVPDDGMGPIDENMHTISIVPKITDPDKDYTVTLDFAIMTSNGKTISANEIYGTKGQYKIVLKGNN